MPVYASRRRASPATATRRGLGRRPAASAAATTATGCTSPRASTARSRRPAPGGATLTRGGRTRRRRAAPTARWVTFDTTANRAVGLQVGHVLHRRSPARGATSTAGGRRVQTSTRSAAAAAARWNAMLRKAQVDGGTHRPAGRLLHRALPRASAPEPGRRRRRRLPGLRRRGPRRERLHADGRTSRCGTPTAPQNQLLELLAPRGRPRRRAVAARRSTREGGWLPRWALGNAETNIMTGDPVTPFLVENWSRGAARRPRGAGLPRAARRTRSARRRRRRRSNGRDGNPCVRDAAATSRAAHAAAGQGRRLRLPAPASATLEYAAADAVARAHGRGRSATPPTRALLAAPRAQNYRNAVGPVDAASSARAGRRRRAGSTLRPADRRRAQFHEGGAYQYQWLVPQDPAGPGRPARRASGPPTRRLDDFFAYASCSPTRPAPRASDWVNAPLRLLQRRHVQPEQRARPARAVHLPVDRAAVEDRDRACAPPRRCSPTARTGMTGNDDLGTMSAWYVLSLARPLPDDERRRLLRREHPAVPAREGHARRDRVAPGRDADDQRAAHERRPAATSPPRASTAGRSAARG